MNCSHCDGQCRLGEADRYGATFFNNDPEGQRAYIARIHRWLKEPWLVGVRAYHAAKCSIGNPTPTFECASCGKFAFPGADRLLLLSQHIRDGGKMIRPPKFTSADVDRAADGRTATIEYTTPDLPPMPAMDPDRTPLLDDAAFAYVFGDDDEDLPDINEIEREIQKLEALDRELDVAFEALDRQGR